jgi:hypothetical protein
LASFRVPVHKLQRNALSAFLRALVVRYRTDTPEEMLAFYVNKTRGAPECLPFAEVRDCPLDLETGDKLGIGVETVSVTHLPFGNLDAETLDCVTREIQKSEKAYLRGSK